MEHPQRFAPSLLLESRRMSELEWLQHVSFAEGFRTLKPALIFAVSVAVFGLVIFHLHRFMARRDHFLITVPGWYGRAVPSSYLSTTCSTWSGTACSCPFSSTCGSGF